jgi:hypothetical protein
MQCKSDAENEQVTIANCSKQLGNGSAFDGSARGLRLPGACRESPRVNDREILENDLDLGSAKRLGLGDEHRFVAPYREKSKLRQLSRFASPDGAAGGDVVRQGCRRQCALRLLDAYARSGAEASRSSS